jgi:hypothetical protein
MMGGESDCDGLHESPCRFPRNRHRAIADRCAILGLGRKDESGEGNREKFVKHDPVGIVARGPLRPPRR